jgi:hypothetical protein
MHRSKRRTIARLVGWGVALGMYASGLVFAADLISAGDASARAEAPPVTVSQPAESPLMTLALAVAAAGGVGAWRLVRVARRPRPAPIRPVGRRITTPT